MSEIDFYFSIGSTYTYLSVTRILDVEKQHQVKFNWKPFSVRAIMKEMNNIPFPKDKMNKVNYMWRDIERRAEGYGFFVLSFQCLICDGSLFFVENCLRVLY